MSARYVGLTTRAIAFVLDAALINLTALVVSGGMALIVSVLRLRESVRTVLLAVGTVVYILWTVGYFVAFWATTGQTPGNRVMRFRVVAATGEQQRPRRALVRCVGLVLAALPLFAGYAMILFDARRRGLHDRLARTVVVDAPQLSLAARRRQQARSSQSGDDDGGSFRQAGLVRKALPRESFET